MNSMKKIALEEHFWTDGFPHTGKVGADLFEPWFLRAIAAALPDFSELRIAAMDKAGIDISVLSLVSPGVQVERDNAKAVSDAHRVNDFLAGEIAKHPTRYAGFAHLPMQEPDAAASASRATRSDQRGRAASCGATSTSAGRSRTRAVAESSTLRRCVVRPCLRDGSNCREKRIVAGGSVVTSTEPVNRS